MFVPSRAPSVYIYSLSGEDDIVQLVKCKRITDGHIHTSVFDWPVGQEQ
jgi:hypothetical protein